MRIWKCLFPFISNALFCRNGYCSQLYNSNLWILKDFKRLFTSGLDPEVGSNLCGGAWKSSFKSTNLFLFFIDNEAWFGFYFPPTHKGWAHISSRPVYSHTFVPDLNLHSEFTLKKKLYTNQIYNGKCYSKSSTPVNRKRFLYVVNVQEMFQNVLCLLGHNS